MKKLITVTLAIIMSLSAFAVPANAEEKLTLDLNKSNSESYEISDKLYGIFLEDISYACDGGLVSNLVNNNSFEYEFNKTAKWIAESLGLSVEEASHPLNSNNPTYATLTANGKGTLRNIGYPELFKYKTYDIDESAKEKADMGFKQGEKYDFSCYIRNVDFDGTVCVYLDSSKNKNNVIQLDISNTKGNWTLISTVLEAVATEDGGLAIELDGNGTICIDFVKLIPQSSFGYGSENWKYTTLRSDLYSALAQLNPSFVRFPGGCFAEGDNLEHLYDWKETIGPDEQRVQGYNLWRWDDAGREYINTNAMGYHEYFQLCADLGAEALPILNAGLICQGRVGYDDHVVALEKASMTDEEWETYMTEVRNMPEDNVEWRNGFTGAVNNCNIHSREDFEAYLDTIALRPKTKEFDAYVQDILDLIEYANGDPNTTYWGALRAANGRTEPFNLKYIGIGNENWGEVYERNFKAIYKEIKAAYPDITIISSAAGWLEGEGFEKNWQWINDGYTDTIVDEHYYTKDGFLYTINDRYDSYDRDKAHVFLGEYAATAQGYGTLQTKCNITNAVEEAAYLTGIERNADIVDMASYAPTFAKNNAQSWDINMIWFDSQEVVLTPSYYVQMLFSSNIGNKYIKSVFANGETNQNGVYESVTVDEENEVLYVKLVNTSGEKQTVDVSFNGYDVNKISVQSMAANYPGACNEVGKNTTYPKEQEIPAADSAEIELGKYDVTVVRIAFGGNDGSGLYTLPDFISTIADTSTFLPAVIKYGVPGGIAAGVIAIAVIVFAVVFVKKKKHRKAQDNQ